MNVVKVFIRKERFFHDKYMVYSHNYEGMASSDLSLNYLSTLMPQLTQFKGLKMVMDRHYQHSFRVEYRYTLTEEDYIQFKEFVRGVLGQEVGLYEYNHAADIACRADFHKLKLAGEASPTWAVVDDSV